jgi:hypothetical protein
MRQAIANRQGAKHAKEGIKSRWILFGALGVLAVDSFCALLQVVFDRSAKKKTHARSRRKKVEIGHGM